VALSFPGEVRTLVEEIADDLVRRLGQGAVFYDNYFPAQLARPSLDVLLQHIYRSANLVVVFLSDHYQRKNWCGVEFNAIKEIMLEHAYHRVMYIRTGEGEVQGVFKTDGYVDARRFSPAQIADFIQQRISLIFTTDSGTPEGVVNNKHSGALEVDLAQRVSGEAREAAPRLTSRELEVLNLAMAGKSTWEISRITNSSEATVNFHMANVRLKFNVNTRQQAVVKAISLGLITPEANDR
jgi:DNA-binding CsgD family transcriptional regulator